MVNQKNPRCSGINADGTPCTKQRSFGHEAGKPQWCQAHAEENATNVLSRKKCEHEGCGRNATCGRPGGPKTVCADHQQAGHINMSVSQCLNPTCTKKGERRYALPGEAARVCHACIEPGMIDVRTKTCEGPGCLATQPMFGVAGGRPTHCGQCKTPAMVNVKDILCPCGKFPTFNLPGHPPRFCLQCKEPDMVDVKNPRCVYIGCDTQPRFGVPGQKAMYCLRHKEPNMVDIMSQFCDVCGTRASYGFDAPTRCAQHKTEGMEDLRNHHCAATDCTRLATFDVPGGKGTHCSLHATDDMVDVKNQRCSKCEGHDRRIAVYNFPGSAPEVCREHREPGMLQRPNGVCLTCPKAIRTPATHGTTKPLHCEAHCEQDEINLTERPCASCGLLMVLDETGCCETCHPQRSQRVLAKQNELMASLDAAGLVGTQTDKVVYRGSCGGMERPDRVFELADRVIIVECDEDQHRERDPTCEQTRMFNVSQYFDGRPVMWIRYNPDQYRPGSATASCATRAQRMRVLERILHTAMRPDAPRPVGFATILYLYFDGADEVTQETAWQVLVPWCPTAAAL